MKSDQSSTAQRKHLENLQNRKQQLIILIGELHSAMNYSKRLIEAINSIEQISGSKFSQNIVSEGYPLLKLGSLQKRIAEQQSRNRELETELASINAALIKLAKTETQPGQ